MAITIIVTNAGRAALVNAVNTGTNAVTITQLGITEAVFAPTAAQVALPGEIKRIPLASGVVVADDQIHVTASDVTADAYAMRGFALYLNDGTLFAIYGQAGAILNKTAQSMMLLAADIAFADIDAELIEFGDTNFILPPATTEILGLVELATTAEGQAGADATRVLTPLTGKQSVLGWLLSQDGSGSGLDADLLDGLHASAFALAGHTHGTMATQNANNVAIIGGAINGVTLGTVNGSAATPALSFTADPDTGFYRGATNMLGVATGGVERVRIDDAGNVGIGGAPAYRLDVHAGFDDAQVVVARFRSANAAANTQQSVNIYSNPTTKRSIIQSYGSAAEGDLSFYCGNNERMLLLATGQLQLSRGSAGAPSLSFLESPGTGIYRPLADTMMFATAGEARAYFRSDGHFLPATTGTYDLGSTGLRWRGLNVTGIDAQTDAGRFIVGPAGAASVKLSSSGTLQYDVGAASSHQFLVNGAQVAQIDSSGRIAVGDADAPIARLHVRGGGGGDTQLRLDSSATQPNVAFYNNSGDGNDRNWAIVASHTAYGDLTFRRSNAAAGDPLNAGTTLFRVLSSGQQQGVNGTAAAPAYSFASDPDTGVMLSAANQLAFVTGGTQRMTVDSTGNVTPGADNTQALGWPTARWRNGYFGTDVLIGGNSAWHGGNDGSGSGLDADLLDGQQGNYYLPAATFAAAQILARLITADGAGSGLDADMLDGFHASAFRRVVDQNLSEYDGYRVWSDGTKECWTRLTINENQSRTWALPVAHTAWVHPSLAISTVAITDVQDNTGITGINGAPPYSITFWNADNRTLTLWVRTLGV